MPTLTILCGGERVQAAFQGTPLLSQALAAAGFGLAQPCGGRGTCGKCAVVALRGAVTPPSAAEARAGVRLSCQARLLGDAQVELPARPSWAAIETATHFSAASTSTNSSATANTTATTATAATTAAPARGAPMAGRYGAAVDLGTTTVAAKVFDLQTGEPLGEHALVNPQTTVAADVMGRISAALSGEGERLRAQARDAVLQAVAGACANAGVPGADALCVAGNTVMLYLLTGRDPQALAVAPFAADERFGWAYDLAGVPAYLPPCAGAFMGADLTCAALATDLCGQAETALLCDIGTNGELMLWHRGALYAASAPAGPAFEGGEISQGCGGVLGAIDKVWPEGGGLGARVIGGGKAIGVCGSGLIDAVAALLTAGRIDATGAADAKAFPLRDGVSLTAGDVRAVQLAKAAIRAAMETLMDAAGAQVSAVKRVLLAGGFGSHIQVGSAAAIGLLPAPLAFKAVAVGNAALTGAAMLLLDTGMRERAEWIAQHAQVVGLGGDAGFERRFFGAMDFPTAGEEP